MFAMFPVGSESKYCNVRSTLPGKMPCASVESPALRPSYPEIRLPTQRSVAKGGAGVAGASVQAVVQPDGGQPSSDRQAVQQAVQVVVVRPGRDKCPQGRVEAEEKRVGRIALVRTIPSCHHDIRRGENSSEHHALCVLYGEYERPVVGAEGGVEVGQATAVSVGGEDTGPWLDLQPGTLCFYIAIFAIFDFLV